MKKGKNKKFTLSNHIHMAIKNNEKNLAESHTNSLPSSHSMLVIAH